VTRLYELTAEFDALMQRSEEGEDVEAALATLQGSIEHKAGGVVRVLRNLEADAEAYGTEEKRLSQRRKSAEAQIERLREYMRSCMAGAGITRIKCGSFSVTLSPGQERVEIVDIDKLDPKYVRTKTQRDADKRAVLADYKADGVIPDGVEIHETTTLRIR
jgi:hypothetical protein